MRGKFLFIAVSGYAFGVALSSTTGVNMLLVPLAIVTCGVCSIAALLTKRTFYTFFAVCIGFTLFGCVRASTVVTTLPPAFSSFLNSQVLAEGVVVTPPDTRETSERLTVELVRQHSKTRIIAVVPPYMQVRIGDVVQVSGKLELPQPFETDSGRTFPYDKFLAKDSVFGIIQPAHIRILSSHISGMQYWLLRAWGVLVAANLFVQHKIQSAIAQPYAALAIGLLLGGKQGLGNDLLNVFTKVGLVQVVVLSGYNVTIVADAVLIVCRRLPRGWSFVLAGISVCAFVVAAGAGSSAVRAAIMSLLAILSRATNRVYDVTRALFLAFFCMVLYNPLLLVYDPGFQLSFLATIGLVLGSPVLLCRLLWIRNIMLRELLATTISAQIFVLPMLLYQNGNLSVVAIPANLLTAPVVPITMALSGIAAVVAMLIPALAPIAGLPAFACLWYIIDIAALLARLPFAQIIIPAFPFYFVLFAYVVLFLLGWYLYAHSPAA